MYIERIAPQPNIFFQNQSKRELGAWTGFFLVIGCALYRNLVSRPFWLDAYLLYVPGIFFILPLILVIACSQITKLSITRLVLSAWIVFVWLCPLEARIEDQQNGPYRIVSINIQSHVTDLSIALRDLRALNADFICIQEIWHRRELVSIENALKGYRVLGAASKDFRRQNFNEGTFVAVRQDWKISNSILKEEFAILEVSRSAEKFNIASIHGPRSSHFGPTDVVQTAQEQRDTAIELSNELKNSSSPTVIAGDFNSPESGPAFKILDANYHQAFKQAGSGLGLTFPSGFPLARIDHVLGSKQIKFTGYTTRDFGSDHLGIIVHFSED
ncbi:MAG: endonuclease/exonuclease/phosphatase family protein [Candidatus Eremiobacteraeota bacterium]|nr:endonuclease/exonuclease/phosphatase family protein [Candidatus Eremiobacteraeota bacterium]